MLHFVEPEKKLTRHWPLLLGAALKRAGPHQDFWVTLPWQDLSANALSNYHRMFQFVATTRSLTSYFLPIQRAQLYCMLNRSFGFSPVGLIHTKNSMRWLQPAAALPVTGQLQLSTAIQLLDSDPSQPLICQFSSYLHPKLEQFPAHPSELPSVYLHCQSHYLLKRGNTSEARAPLQAPELTTASAHWQATVRAARQYAWLSGDLNPIHLSNLSAKLLGMRQAIMHGMHTVAMVEATLTQQQAPLIALSANFKRALPLGQSAHLFRHSADSGSVWQADNLVMQFDNC